MRGLLVAATSHAADAAAVAECAAEALKRSGTPARAVTALALGDGDASAVQAFAAQASPLVAARHAGAEIAPGLLAAALRERAGGQVLVAAIPGGLLAPLTPRYAVRDLGAELRMPVVLAAATGPDALNLVRLSAEAARGAGVAVAAAVLTGWPDPPNRVLLDERRLLGELTGLPVAVLPAAPSARGEAAREWRVAEWLAAVPEAPPAPIPRPSAPPAAAAPGEPAPAMPPGAAPAEAAASAAAAEAAAGAAAGPRAPVVLEPYAAWQARPVGDPRATPRPRIMEAMLEIIAVEGPMRATRAYALYNRASGGRKLTSIARAPLSSAVYWLAQERRIVLTRRDEIPWQDDDLVRLPDAPAVRVRELGPRTLEEVPLDEISELMRRLRSARGVRSETQLKRAVLDAYGLVRLTTKADEYLGLAVGLMDEPPQ